MALFNPNVIWDVGFQLLSLSSMIANPLILPAQPPVMILGGLAVIVGLIYVPLGQLLAYLAWPFVVYTIRVVELIANIPHGVLFLGKVPSAAPVAPLPTFPQRRTLFFLDRNPDTKANVLVHQQGITGAQIVDFNIVAITDVMFAQSKSLEFDI